MKKDKIIKAIIDNDRVALYELVTGEKALKTVYSLIGEGEGVTRIEDVDGEVTAIKDTNGRIWDGEGNETTLKKVMRYKPPLVFISLLDHQKDLIPKIKDAPNGEMKL